MCNVFFLKEFLFTCSFFFKKKKKNNEIHCNLDGNFFLLAFVNWKINQSSFDFFLLINFIKFFLFFSSELIKFQTSFKF